MVFVQKECWEIKYHAVTTCQYFMTMHENN